MILSSLLLPLDRCRIGIIIVESGKNLVDSLSSQVQRVAASKILCTSAKQLQPITKHWCCFIYACVGVYLRPMYSHCLTSLRRCGLHSWGYQTITDRFLKRSMFTADAEAIDVFPSRRWVDLLVESMVWFGWRTDSFPLRRTISYIVDC